MVKIISLSEEAYHKLKAVKKDRSFSKTVLDLLEKDKNIMRFAGALKQNNDEWKTIQETLRADRKKIQVR